MSLIRYVMYGATTRARPRQRGWRGGSARRVAAWGVRGAGRCGAGRAERARAASPGYGGRKQPKLVSQKKKRLLHQPSPGSSQRPVREASEAHGKTEGKSASLPFGRCGVPRHASARDAARCGCRALREVVAHLCSRLRLHHEAAGVRVPLRAANLGRLPHLTCCGRDRAQPTLPRGVPLGANPSCSPGCAGLGSRPMGLQRQPQFSSSYILHLPRQIVDEAAAERVESTARTTSSKRQRCAPAPAAMPTSTGPFWFWSTCCACCATRSRPLPRHGSGRERVV